MFCNYDEEEKEIDGMGKRLEQVSEKLSSVRKQLEKMEQEKADKTLKGEEQIKKDTHLFTTVESTFCHSLIKYC